MLVAKDGYCLNCERITYFVPTEVGYECQSCLGINTMQGMKDMEMDSETKLDTLKDLYLPEDEF